MKLIFLDIDGVLNTRRSLRLQGGNPDKKHWCRVGSRTIQLLCSKMDCRIVVSSTWRYEYPWPALKQIFAANRIDPNYLIGKTPFISSPPGEPFSTRPDEIMQWIQVHGQKISSYIIIDDNIAPRPSQESHCVHVDPAIGLADKKKFRECIMRLSPGVTVV